MQSVLISGASGFVGQNLAEHLNQGNFETLALNRSSENKAPFKATHTWDQELPETNIIIHLAGKAHDTSNTSDPQSYFDINVGLTKQLFEHFLKSSAEVFIMFSSVKAVADTVPDILTEENHSSSPKTPYGQSKLEAEQYLLSHDLPENKKLYIIRPCMIFGPGNKGNLNLLYSVVKKGVPYPLGSFDNRRSFLSTKNLCYLTQQLIEKKPDSAVFNFSDDGVLSTNDIIRLIAKALDRKPRILNISKVLIKLGASIGGVLKLPLNPERLNKLTENYVVDNTKVKNALGIDKLPHSTSETMEETLRGF